METFKAGCFLVNKESHKIALIYREKQKDLTFPKGHLEENEDLKTCAIRETAEETKRVAAIIDKYEPYIERYTTPKGKKCVCYMYIAIDCGHSNNPSLDTHEVRWTDIEDVEKLLSYQTLQNAWKVTKPKIIEIINS